MFSAANIAMLFRTTQLVGDTFTNGELTLSLDKIGDRAEAAAIVMEESAELFRAVADAARNGVDESEIHRIVAEAKDVAEAKKLLVDPALYVVLDGEQTTADDDAPPPADKAKDAGGEKGGKK